MRWRLKYLILYLSLFVFQLQVSGIEGESLFTENCAICHTIGKGKLIGPDLKNIDKSRTLKYFLSFVKNSQAVIKSGDSTAVSVFKNYDEIIMPEHSLSETEITEIWQFIQTFKGEAYFEYTFPSTINQSSNTWIIYLAALLIVLAGLAVIKRKWLVQNLEKVTKRIPFLQASKNNWKSILRLIFVIFILLELNNNGIFTGYKPKQPILFSHEVHCTQNKISCKYCHYEAYTEEHGGIPPLLTCMNCHRYVNKGTLTDTAEIAKLYDWAGFDFKSKKYNKEIKQLAWIKVYNLPDHARFNHHIHTQANVTCTKCHGKVEKMKEIKQATSMTMKWCIDCHTKSKIPLVGYYAGNNEKKKNYEAVSAEERANFNLRSDTIYTAYKNMGGLDCYKCHN